MNEGTWWGDFTKELVPLLQTGIIATFAYVAKLLRDIRHDVSALREDVQEIERRYERHEVWSEASHMATKDRIREVNRRLSSLEKSGNENGEET